MLIIIHSTFLQINHLLLSQSLTVLTVGKLVPLWINGEWSPSCLQVRPGNTDLNVEHVIAAPKGLTGLLNERKLAVAGASETCQ